MALNLSEEDLISLGITIDEDGQARFNAAMDEVEEKVQTSIGALQEFVANIGSLQDMVGQLGGVDEGWLKVSSDIDRSTLSLQEFVDQQQAGIDKAQQLQDIIAASNASAIGYGNAGGLIGPAEAPVGPQIGSAFAVGHGLSVAGHATGSAELREAGGLIYIEEALRKLKPIVQDVNQALIASGGLFPTLTASLVAANIPMAGLIATLAPLAVAAIATGLALKSIFDKLHEGKEAIDAALAGLDTYYKAIEKGTTESITADIAALNTSIAIHQRYADQLQTEITNGELAAAAKGVLAEQEYNLSESTKALKAKYEEQKKIVDDDKASVEALNRAYGANEVVIRSLLAAADQHRQSYATEADMAAMSTSALDNRVAAMKRDQAAIDSEIDYLEQSGDTSKETQDKLKSLNVERNKESALIEFAQNVLRPLSAAREAEIGQYKAMRQAAEDRRTEIEREGAEYLDKVTKEREAKQKQDDDAVKATLKNEEDIKKAQDDGDQAQLEIQQKYIDKTKEIVKKAQDDAHADYTKLLQKQYDLRQTAFRTEEKETAQAQEKALDLEIKESRQERDAYTEHLQKLRDIEKRFHDQGEQDLLDRNFIGLIKQKKSHVDAINEENQHFTDKIAKDRQHLADEESDLSRHLEFERRLRQTALTYALNDAYTNYQRELSALGDKSQRELQLAQDTETKELNMAVQKTTRKITLLGQEYKAELDLIYQTETAKMQIYAQALARVRSMGYGSTGLTPAPSAISPYTTLGSGGPVRRQFAEGGPFDAFRAFEMSEKSPETLRIGGNAYNIGDKAIVIPMQSGSVEKGTHGGMTNNFYITGANGDEIAHKVLDIMERVMPQ